MENASKALLMAAGVLIGILILSLAVYLFVTFGSSVREIHDKKAQQEIVEFNSKFTSYEDEDRKITIYDIVTIANYAKENNLNYGYTSTSDKSKLYYVTVHFENKRNIEFDNNEQLVIEGDINTTYECKIYYDKNGRVNKIWFQPK